MRLLSEYVANIRQTAFCPFILKIQLKSANLTSGRNASVVQLAQQKQYNNNNNSAFVFKIYLAVK
jgi:hypothetical protein